MLLQYNKYRDFFHCTQNTLNLYEQPGEIHDSITEAKSTQSKFANDVVSRQIFHRYSSQQQHFLSTVILWFLFFFSFLLYFLLLFVCVCKCFKQKVYTVIHIRLCGRVSDKMNFTQPISQNKTTFFWPRKKKHNKHSSVFKVLR